MSTELGWVPYTDEHTDGDPPTTLDATAVRSLAWDIARADLKSVLLALVAIHEPTSGKELLQDHLAAVSKQCSPGTLYPKLHDLEEEGYLERTDLCGREQRWMVANTEATEERLTQAAAQLTALAQLLQFAATASDGEGFDQDRRLELLLGDGSA